MFDQQLSMKVVLLVTAAFAIICVGGFFLTLGRKVDAADLGTIDMNDERRRDLIDAEARRWNP